MLKEILQNVYDTKPLIHTITNYVTANDCANILLASDAKPIMADDPHEAEDITSISDGLCINIGTLNPNKLEAMLLAGKKANVLNHPVLLDPVGAGASRFRKDALKQLLEMIHFDVIRGNLSEIKTLMYETTDVSGVDSAETITDTNIHSVIALSRQASIQLHSIIVITGKIDVISNSTQSYCVYNGHPYMSRITGTGCMLSALMTAYITSNKENTLEACAGSCCAMGISGEIGVDRMKESDGNGSLRNYMLDAIFNLTPEELERRAKYELR